MWLWWLRVERLWGIETRCASDTHIYASFKVRNLDLSSRVLFHFKILLLFPDTEPIHTQYKLNWRNIIFLLIHCQYFRYYLCTGRFIFGSISSGSRAYSMGSVYFVFALEKVSCRWPKKEF